MSLDDVFSGEYVEDREAVIASLDRYAENYAKIDDVRIRRGHDRSALELIREIFWSKEGCDEERIRSCYRYYLDRKVDLIGKCGYPGDVI